NDPAGLRKAASKLFLAGLPGHLRPRTAIASRVEQLREFVEDAPGPCVAKPLVGTRGQGVFKLSADDPNLQAILSTLTGEGPAMVQDYMPEAAGGDLRLIVLEGEPLTMNGKVASVQRVPSPSDWRSNIHLGGSPAAGKPTAEQLAAGRELGRLLLAEGISLAGLDMIGARAVEVNVFSTGGLRDANAFSAQNFCTPILEAFERRLREPRVPSAT
ncbi:MAG: glutathione synthase, partial [Planctomycetes bacterium]|nr:glutathione synthase [Planctomycetota bacterium]